MSYNVGIWKGDAVPDFQTMSKRFNDTWDELDSEAGIAPDPDLVSFVRALLNRFPEPAEDDDDFDEESWVWSDTPLLNNIVGRFCVLGMGFSAVDLVLPELLKAARAHRLHVIDWGAEKVYVAPASS